MNTNIEPANPREPSSSKESIGTIEAEIRKHPFLKDLSPHQYRLLEDNGMQVHFRKGEAIFRQGDPANRFYLLQHGRVAIEAWLPGQGKAIIQTLSGGDILGWSWMFPPYYWQFSARAVEPTDAIFIYGTPLREECEDDHELGYQLMKRSAQVMVGRLQATRRRLVGPPQAWTAGI